MASTIGAINPFRYRGYYYDTETKLYYLNSRYYDPETGRFINSDNIEYLGANGDFVNYNLFAYCGNNPTMHVDKNGHFAISVALLCALIGATIGSIVGGTIAYNNAVDEGKEGEEVVIETIEGVLIGGTIGYLAGYFAGFFITKATGVLGFSYINGQIFTITETIVLGHFPQYVELAKSLNLGHYQIPPELYNSMNDTQRWAMNSQYINDCMKLGANFLIEPNRVISAWLYEEINLILQSGSYQWLEDFSALVKMIFS